MTQPAPIGLRVDQAPGEVLDYEWDWTEELSEDADTITSADISIDPTGMVEDEAKRTVGTAAVSAWFSGGTLGVDYDLTCEIVTAQGREFERSIRVRIRKK